MGNDKTLFALKRKPPQPKPVSGPELHHWVANPNVRIRAGRACMAVAQAVAMMQRQLDEQEARHAKALRDCQEQTAQQIADWLRGPGLVSYANEHEWAGSDGPGPGGRYHLTGFRYGAARAIREGVWLPPESDVSESLTPEPPTQPTPVL